MRVILLLYVLLNLQALLGQDNNRILLDKIIATIGDKIILSSDLSNQIVDMQRQGIEIPENGYCLILEQEIAKKAMTMQAEKDSILVSEDEINNEVDNRIRYFMNLYGSKSELEQIAGKNIFQMKEYFKEPLRESLLARNMQAKIIENVHVTPIEVRRFFDTQDKDKLPFYEAEFEVGQIILYPKANKDVEQYTIETLLEYKSRVENKTATFEHLAMMYSDDPGSKNNGGKYEVNINEKHWDPVFLSTAFRLKPGEISPVVKSRFGYHIIQMTSKYGDDAIVRHILKIPQILKANIDEKLDKAKMIREGIIHGKMSFSEAVREYSEDESSKFTGGFLMNKAQSTTLTIDELDKSIIPYLSDLEIEQYSQPFIFNDEKGQVGIKIIYLKSKTKPHRENLQDDYLKIANRYLEQKKSKILEEWLKEKVATFYLNVDDQYRECSKTITKWLKDSQKNSYYFSSIIDK